MELEFFMPMKKIPTTTHQQKKVTCKNGKINFYEDENLAKARSIFMSALYPHVPEHKFNGPVRLIIKALFPLTKTTKEGQWKTTKPDTDNFPKLLKDCMTDLGFWKDDAIVASLISEKFHSKNVGIYINVKELKNHG